MAIIILKSIFVAVIPVHAGIQANFSYESKGTWMPAVAGHDEVVVDRKGFKCLAPHAALRYALLDNFWQITGLLNRMDLQQERFLVRLCEDSEYGSTSSP